MERECCITLLKEYFSIQELVSEKVYQRYGSDAWALFRTEALTCLYLMRVGIDKKFTINTWHKSGGGAQQRGFRENISEICKSKTDKGKLYTSGHVLGCAFDITVEGMTSIDVRKWIVENADLFPCKVRLEDKMNGVPISWTHFDTKYYDQHPKVYLFDV